jgi:hypothetical protein
MKKRNACGRAAAGYGERVRAPVAFAILVGGLAVIVFALVKLVSDGSEETVPWGLESVSADGETLVVRWFAAIRIASTSRTLK